MGDIIEGESLDPLGDVDTFVLDGHRGDDINIFLYGLDERWTQSMSLMLGYSAGRTEPLGLAYSAGEGDSGNYTGHIVLPADGSYPMVVGPDGGSSSANYGPYRVVVQRVSGAVEHHAAEMSVGDVVSDERLDDWNDLDEFTLTGAPGQLVAASVSADPSTMGVRLEMVDPATRETLAWTTSTPDRPIGVTDAIAIPSSGTVAVRAYRAIQVVPGTVGDYELEVHSFDPAPEGVAAVIAIGDTVRGEWVDPLGDIDEYTFSGTAGDVLMAYFDVVSSPDPEWPLKLEVLDSASDEILGSIAIPAGSELGDWHTGAFSIPVSGSYVVRVSGYDREHGSGEYAFTVQRAP